MSRTILAFFLSSLVAIGLCSEAYAQTQPGTPTPPVNPQPNPQTFGGEDAWDIVLPYFFPAEVAAHPDLAHEFNLILDVHPLGGTPSVPGSDFVSGTLVLSSSGGQTTGPEFTLDALQTVDVPLTQDMIDAEIDSFTLVIGQMSHADPALGLDMLVVGTAVTYLQRPTHFIISACFDNSTQGRSAADEVLQMFWDLRVPPTIICSVQTVALTNCEQNINNQATACSDQNWNEFQIAAGGCGGAAAVTCIICCGTPPPATVVPCTLCAGALVCVGVAAQDMLRDAFAIGSRRSASLACCCLYAETLDQGGTWMNPPCSFTCP